MTDFAENFVGFLRKPCRISTKTLSDFAKIQQDYTPPDFINSPFP